MYKIIKVYGENVEINGDVNCFFECEENNIFNTFVRCF